MKVVFKKSHLPFLKGTLHGGHGRDFWNLTRTMQDENGLQHQLPAEITLLQKGADEGDVWAMCELPRTYFIHCGDMFLPLAFRFWKKAIAQGDQGAKWDIENRNIRERILAYKSFDGNKYKEIEMKCALLAELYLTNFGISPWETLDNATKKSRIEALVKEVCPVLQIPDTKVLFTPNLFFQERLVDALAHWDGKVEFREELLCDLERMIEIIFHELGHIVAFEIKKNPARAEKLKTMYGITNERIASWDRGDMGYEVSTFEEDPDTLSYGVYTLWATFFCLP
jgi:hypothetical protein